MILVMGTGSSPQSIQVCGVDFKDTCQGFVWVLGLQSLDQEMVHSGNTLLLLLLNLGSSKGACGDT